MQVTSVSALLKPHNLSLREVSLHIAFFMPLWLVIGRAWADIGVTAIAASFLIHLFMCRDFSLFKNLEIKGLVIFWLLLVLTTCMEAESQKNILKSLAYMRFILFYAALRYWLFVDYTALKRAALWALPVLGFVVVDGLYQYIDGRYSLTGKSMMGAEMDRLTGPFSHPNFGNYLFKILLPISIIWLVACYQNPRIRWLSLMVASVGVVLIPLSGERSVTLMLLAFICSFLLLAIIGVKQYRKYLFCAAGLVVLAVALLSTQPIISERSALFFQQVSRFSETVYGQLFYAGYLLWQQAPWLGSGLNSFEAACLGYQNAAIVNYCDIHPHNTYIQIASSAGLLGLTCILGVLFSLVIESFKRFANGHGKQRLLVSAQIALLAGLLFPALVTQSIYSNWPASIFWFSLALIISLKHVSVSHD